VLGRGFAVEIRHTINKAGIALIDMRKDLSHDDRQSGRLPTLIGDMNYKSVAAVACNPPTLYCGQVCDDDGRPRRGCCFPWPISNVAAMSSDLVGLAGPGLARLVRSRLRAPALVPQ
jgi:hypothetical protein